MSGIAFTYFVVFGEMRTGSNYLESNLGLFDDVKCYGELFNPQFVGGPNRKDVFGTSLSERNRAPLELLGKMVDSSPAGIPGFRFFSDHDSRVLEHCLDDPACAKIVLTRNPLDSYVSRKIAAQTGQWKLTNIRHRRSAQIEFSAKEFERYLGELQNFQIRIQRALQVTGQSAFYISYDDINDIEIVNGLGKFLGCQQKLTSLDKKIKRQNPEPLSSKVSNFAEIEPALRDIDFMNMSATPNFEPRRGAAVPSYVAADHARLLFLPIKGGPVEQVIDWLQAHARADGETAHSGFSQKTLRDWRQNHENALSFTAIRHPVARAYNCFLRCVLSNDDDRYGDLRKVLQRDYGVDPEAGDSRDSFLAFLKFVKASLAEQTGMRIDPVWASQSAILQGISSVAPPGVVIKEQHLSKGLAYIESQNGLPSMAVGSRQTDKMAALTHIYDAAVERHARAAYSRDYLQFGFGDWRPTD